MTEPVVCEHCAHEPSYQRREAFQQPYRGQWHALVEWAADRQRSGFPIYPDDLIRTIHRLADEQPDARAATAHRTTRYGREGEAE
jgi:hypothetical protein